MFRAEFARRGLDPKNLSRTLEDAGTITSVLVPWNTCGAYMASTLGVATLTYAPFCFFNLINNININSNNRTKIMIILLLVVTKSS